MFKFRPLTKRDLPLVHEWLQRPHVAEWWEGDISLYDDGTRQYIACLNDQPFAYVQVYFERPGLYGTDQFLGDSENLGTELVRELTKLVFSDPQVTRIQVDPAPDNARAIHCYEKAGFRRGGIVNGPDGPALMMFLERE